MRQVNAIEWKTASAPKIRSPDNIGEDDKLLREFLIFTSGFIAEYSSFFAFYF